ncbi:MAG: redox-regulated ATPase YchF [Actinomycetota bacterium]
MKVGIVGLPNAGKTTLFNALTRAAAQTASYPFTTVEPNVAIVEVPDPRLAAVAEAASASPQVPETIEFHDIAGLVPGASTGEGLGNRFLAEIRETDAICHVVRVHSDARVPHPEGRIDPVADAEVVDAELLLADLEQAQGRLERVRKQAGGAKEAAAELDWLERVVEGLGRGAPARAVAIPALAPNAPAELQALSSKPVLYVANLDEGESEPPATLVEHARRQDAGCIGVSARIEAELAELPEAEAKEMRSELGLAESGLERLVRAAYELLDLLTFFTAHRGSEARARALRRGLTAWDAAGKVHTEIQAGFVRAEVIGWRELVDAGGYGEARERGLIRTEGREYAVRDGDVITIRH